MQSTSAHRKEVPIVNEADFNASSRLGDNHSVAVKEIDSFLESIYRIKHWSSGRTQFDINRHLTDFLNEPLLKSDENILEYWKNKKITDPHLYSLANISPR